MLLIALDDATIALEDALTAPDPIRTLPRRLHDRLKAIIEDLTEIQHSLEAMPADVVREQQEDALHAMMDAMERTFP